MAKATILFADNDPDFLKSRQEYLEYQGYEVIPVIDPIEARQVLERGQIDIAILDIRMMNDDDEKDTTGLILARETAHSVPKIILSGFPTYEAVREALQPDLEGLSPAVDFIGKQEGPEILVEAVRRILKLEVREFQETVDRVTEELQKAYENAQRQGQISQWASLSGIIVGVVILLTGIGLAFSGILTIGMVSIVAGIAVEGWSLLFFRRTDTINRRLETLHMALLQFRQLEALLASCDERCSQEEREECQTQMREIMRRTAEQLTTVVSMLFSQSSS